MCWTGPWRGRARVLLECQLHVKSVYRLCVCLQMTMNFWNWAKKVPLWRSSQEPEWSNICSMFLNIWAVCQNLSALWAPYVKLLQHRTLMTEDSPCQAVRNTTIEQSKCYIASLKLALPLFDKPQTLTATIITFVFYSNCIRAAGLANRQIPDITLSLILFLSPVFNSSATSLEIKGAEGEGFTRPNNATRMTVRIAEKMKCAIQYYCVWRTKTYFSFINARANLCAAFASNPGFKFKCAPFWPGSSWALLQYKRSHTAGGCLHRFSALWMAHNHSTYKLRRLRDAARSFRVPILSVLLLLQLSFPHTAVLLWRKTLPVRRRARTDEAKQVWRNRTRK